MHGDDRKEIFTYHLWCKSIEFGYFKHDVALIAIALPFRKEYLQNRNMFNNQDVKNIRTNGPLSTDPPQVTSSARYIFLINDFQNYQFSPPSGKKR